MAFRRKNVRVLKYKPDIMIIPECENENKLKFDDLIPRPNDFIWYGENDNKGIGIFSYSGYKFNLLERHNPKYRFILPIEITGKNTFYIIAVWAMNERKNNYEQRYIGQVWSGLNYYIDLLEKDILIVGDFNWNKIWDNEKWLTGNLSQIVEFLSNYNISSVYHTINNESFGKETQPTFYLQRKIEKPYHIDYCFIKNRMIRSGIDINIGEYDSWINFSDHMPVVIDC